MTDRRFDGKGEPKNRMETELTRIARLAALFVPLALAACAGGSGPKLDCPQVAVLQQASRLVRSAGPSDEVAARIIDARVTGVAGKCTARGHHGERVVFRIGFAATKGLAARQDDFTLPYFVAITEGDSIIAKQVYPVRFDFRNGATQAVATTKPIRLDFPNAPRSAAQQVLVGFQMTPSELGQARGTAR